MRNAVEHFLRVRHEVHLVDGDDDVTRCQAGARCTRAGATAAARLARVDQDDRERRAVDAPVAMLRVYCSWPGVSAMMNLRRGVEK